MDTEDNIRNTADIVAIHEDIHGKTQILLIKRKYEPFKNCWALPGGHVDPGESPVEAAARELREETGVELGLQFLSKIGEYSTPGRDPRGNYHTVTFLAELPVRATPTAGDDAAAARWFTYSSSLNRRLAFDHARIVLDAMIEREFNKLGRELETRSDNS
jgi:8-oxo-dGTP diphosphatase